MYALDYSAASVQKPDGEVIVTANTKGRSRSNSLSSATSDSHRVKPPHTEGHIKWLTTVSVPEVHGCFQSDG